MSDLLLSQLATSFKDRSAARPVAASRPTGSTMLMGMVVGQDGPIHVVDVLGEGGQAGARIMGVICADGPPRGVGSQVLLTYVGRNPIPYIVGGGGGQRGPVAGSPIEIITAQVFG